MPKTIKISKKEYEGMKETIELLQNEKAVKKLIDSLKETERINKAIRKIRDEDWKKALKKAGGDEDKAVSIFYKEKEKNE